MSVSKGPMYGNFLLDTEFNLSVLIERIIQISAHFFENREFSTYLITQDGRRFYGLDFSELNDRYEEEKGKIKTISTSASSPNGKSVRINIQFRANSVHGYGRYVIATNRRQANLEIEEMLKGVWIPRPDPDPIALLDILEGVKKARVRIEVEEEAARMVQKKMASLHPIKDRFHADKHVSVEIILNLLEEISVIFLEDTPFQIQLTTTHGILRFDHNTDELKRYFIQQRAKIFRMSLKAYSNDGQVVIIRLSFDPFSVEPNAKVEITAFEGKEVQLLIREVLSVENGGESVMTGVEMLSENFRFDEATFNMDRVISLIQTLSSNYLQRATPAVSFSNRLGETFPHLNLSQLEELYERYLDSVNLISITLSKTATNKIFTLVLQFGNETVDAYGSFSIRWGDKKIHIEVRKLIWGKLDLMPFTSPGVTSFPKVRDMLLTPVFQNRKFSKQDNTCLISMPLEAYWSETLWVHIQTTLQAVGIDAIRAEPLFISGKLEESWTYLNQVEALIADLTYKHPDVFYQIGIAHTLGKPVFLISQHARDIPVDFQQFPHKVYNNNIPGLRELAEALRDFVDELADQ